MEKVLLSEEEAAAARACGIGVFASSDPAFGEKCRQMKLDLPEGGGEAIMLEYDLASPFMLGIVIVFGAVAIFMTWHLLPPEVPVLLGALFLFGCVSLLRSRQRSVFTAKALYVGFYHGLWWEVREADAAEDMAVYWHRQPKVGISLRLRTPMKNLELLSPFAPGTARDWTEAFFHRWRHWSKERREAVSADAEGERRF